MNYPQSTLVPCSMRHRRQGLFAGAEKAAGVKVPGGEAARSRADTGGGDQDSRRGAAGEWLIGDLTPVRSGEVRIIEGQEGA